MASPLALATKLAEDKRRAAGKGDRGKHATAAAAKAAKAAGSGGDVSDLQTSLSVWMCALVGGARAIVGGTMVDRGKDITAAKATKAVGDVVCLYSTECG